jgi:hypothetical protein
MLCVAWLVAAVAMILPATTTHLYAIVPSAICRSACTLGRKT